MIYIIDKTSIGNVHTMFNESVIKLLSSMYPNEPICFLAEAKNQQIVRSKLEGWPAEHVHFEEIKIVPAGKGRIASLKGRISKIISDYFFFRKILKKASAQSDSLIFLCSAPTLTFYFFKKLKAKFPQVPVIATLHGEVEYAYFPTTATEQKVGDFYKRIFQLKTERFNYLLLNKISKNKLLSDQPIKANEIIEINHPYLVDRQNKHTDIFKSNPLILGHIGSLGTRKNSQLIYDLAARFKENIEQGAIRFSTIGAVEPSARPFMNEYVEDFSKGNTGYISTEMYLQKIEEIDYALFFWKPEQFFFRFSGPVIDFLTFGKPIIALKHPYFDYMFSIGGNMGFLCDTLDDMVQLVRRLLDKDPELLGQYDQQVANINNYKDHISVKNVAADFKKQIEAYHIRN